MATPTSSTLLATPLYCLMALALLPAAPSWAAAVSLCESRTPTANAETELYGPNGQLLRLSVADVPVEGCVSADLPVPTAAVRWFMLTDIPAAEAPPRALGLQGYFDAHDARVSELIYAQAEVPGAPGYIPFFSDMQPYLRIRSFGVEERAVFEGGRLTCTAGTQVAGIALHANALWEHLAGTALEISARGSGEFDLAIADAAREREERPLGLGVVKPGNPAITARYSLPTQDQRWTSLAIFCPKSASSLTLEALRLVPARHAPPGGRATWLWEPALWRDTPESVWQIVRQEGLRKIFITVPVAETGDVTDPGLLAAFVAAAGALNVEVWAVLGDRSDVLPENLPLLLARAAAYLRFNAAHPQAPLAGLQLDIEPYLLPGSTLAPDYWRQRYIATVTAVHAQLAQQLPLDLVMPVWWGAHPAWGAPLLDALKLPQLSLTVMNYRTDLDALRAGAMPFFAWGEANGRGITMALEKGRAGVNAGNGREETRIDYAAAATAGELWLLELGGMSLLLLLDSPHADLPGQVYAKTGERTISIGTISFAGAAQNLEATATALEAEWSAWTSFAGLAIHGLDQPDGPGR